MFSASADALIGGREGDGVAAEVLASGEAGVHGNEVRGGGVRRAPAGADGGPHGGVMVAREGGEIFAGSLLNGAEDIEGGGEIAFHGDGGAGALGQRIEGGIDARGEGLDVLAVGGSEGNGVDHDLRPVGTAHAADQEGLVVDAAGGRGGGRDVEQEGRLAIDSQVVDRGMDGVAFERAEEGREGLRFEQGGAGGEAVAHVVGERLAFGVIEDQVGEVRRFGRAQRQFQGNGRHATTLQQAIDELRHPRIHPIGRLGELVEHFALGIDDVGFRVHECAVVLVQLQSHER